MAVASDQKERKRRGNGAHQHSRANYDWPLIGARVAGIYDELAGRLDTQRAARTRGA